MNNRTSRKHRRPLCDSARMNTTNEYNASLWNQEYLLRDHFVSKNHTDVVSTTCKLFGRSKPKSKHKPMKPRQSTFAKNNRTLNRIVKAAKDKLSGRGNKDVHRNQCSSLDAKDEKENFRNISDSESMAETSLLSLGSMSLSESSKDPRHQIRMSLTNASTFRERKIKIIHDEAVEKVEAFSVWRPTSNDAIQKIITGEGIGKGMDVKGKSAKKGKLSGFIPFVQIHEEIHKSKILWPPRDGTIRIYYKSKISRNRAALELTTVSNEMKAAFSEAQKIIINKSSADEAQFQVALENLIFDVADPTVYRLDNYLPSFFGVVVSERIFFNTYISQQSIARCSEYETGRPSEPAFQDMNFECIRKYKGKGPRAVVLQLSETMENVLKPQSLVVAYEEHNTVIPVVSDFDCFLVGTRNIDFESSLSEKQTSIMKWLLTKIETILDSQKNSKSWTSRWLDVLKENEGKEFSSEMPELGFGDPTSYTIMKNVVGYTKSNGAVRHGAECFNYLFPQELDDEFLVIFNDLNSDSKIPWKHVGVKELQNMLCDRIEQGYAFPLNPKWILVDYGWKALYDKMMSSKNENIQKSLAVWYPLGSGIRELIEKIYMRFPDGFQTLNTCNTNKDHRAESTEAMDLAQQELRRQLILKRAYFKLRCALQLMKHTRGYM